MRTFAAVILGVGGVITLLWGAFLAAYGGDVEGAEPVVNLGSRGLTAVIVAVLLVRRRPWL